MVLCINLWIFSMVDLKGILKVLKWGDAHYFTFMNPTLSSTINAHFISTFHNATAMKDKHAVDVLH